MTVSTPTPGDEVGKRGEPNTDEITGLPVRVVRLDTGLQMTEFERMYSFKTIGNLLEVSGTSLKRWEREGHLECVTTTAGKRVYHRNLVKFVNEYFMNPAATTSRFKKKEEA